VNVTLLNIDSEFE